MRFAALSHPLSNNIGDEIQTVAAMSLLPRVDCFIDRDRMNQYRGDQVAVIMNGWFSEQPDNWPPAPNIRPIFVGFHLARQAEKSYARFSDYLAQRGPIGCRDPGTQATLRAWGVEAYTTFCCTLSLPRRERAPPAGKPVIVDAGHIKIPRSIRKSGIQVSHSVGRISTDTKLRYAKELLQFYRDEASLIITTRLHCALPGIAMGIPVVYFGKVADYRTAIINMVGGHIYNQRLHGANFMGLPGRLIEPVDWSPAPLDVGPIVDKIRSDVANRVAGLDG